MILPLSSGTCSISSGSYRAVASRPGSIPGGRSLVLMTARVAISAIVTAGAGLPATWTRPASITKSSVGASSMWAAIFLTLSRTSPAAIRMAPPPMTA